MRAEDSSVPEEREPTREQAEDLQRAFEFFNEELFDGKLPRTMLTYTRKWGRVLGHYAADRWRDGDAGVWVGEIGLNSQQVLQRGTVDVLSTLVHEMVHLQQARFGKPSRKGYHNREWADWMLRVGLVPSHTGEPGGQQVGQKMDHYVESGGAFDRACQNLLQSGFVLRWSERAHADSKLQTKVTYLCLKCGMRVWGKPDLQIDCGRCRRRLKRWSQRGKVRR